MSGRYYLYSLAVVTVVSAGIFFFRSAAQTQPKTYEGPKWTYHVTQLDAGQCTSAGLSASLDASGQSGWELVGYTQLPEESSFLIQMTSTYGKPMADSFAGTLKPAESGCRLVFKRLVR
jgi:hypothetical protein